MATVLAMLLCCFPFSIYVQLGHVTCIVLWHMNRSKMFWTKAVKSAQSSPCSFPLYPWDQQCERGDILSYWIGEWIQMEQMELTHIVHITWPRTKPLWLWTTQILGLFVQMFVIFASVTYNHQISLAFIYYIYIYIYIYFLLSSWQVSGTPWSMCLIQGPKVEGHQLSVAFHAVAESQESKSNSYFKQFKWHHVL